MMNNLLVPKREFVERWRAVRLAVVSGRKPDMAVEGSGEAGLIFEATHPRHLGNLSRRPAKLMTSTSKAFLQNIVRRRLPIGLLKKMG